MDTLRQDVRYAVRSLRKHAGFTAVAAITLALGIGANTAIFSAIEALLLRPLPFRDPDRLVRVWQTAPGEPAIATAPANFLDWRADSKTFEELAAYSETARNLTSASQAQRVNVVSVSSNFFRALGVDAARGIAFGKGAEGREAVLSHELWQRAFGAEPDILGRSLTIDGHSFDVVGVLPPRSGFPEDGDVWVRAAQDIPETPIGVPGDLTKLRDARYLGVLGRLRSHSGVAEARAEMDVIAGRLQKEYPNDNADLGIRVVPLQDDLVSQARPTLILLMGAVGFVLLIASLNVANLLLARSVSRGREMAIRAALGAGRRRVVRQLLTESAILGLLGGALGVVLAVWGLPFLRVTLPQDTPRLAEVSLSAPVLGFTLAISLLSALLFGLAPALQMSRDALAAALQGGRIATADPARHRLRGLLAAGEIALALVLVVGAGLLVKSLWRLQQTSPGFHPDGVLTLRISLPPADGQTPASRRAFFDEVVERFREIPGVQAVGATGRLPLTGRSISAEVRVQGRSYAPSEAPNACWRTATPGYFSALQIPLLKGRMFSAADANGAQPVALVNQTLALRLWPGADPIGQRISTAMDGEDGFWATVVGVVGDTAQQSVAVSVLPEMYRPFAQESLFPGDSMTIAARVDGEPERMVPAFRAALAALDRQAPISDVKTMESVGQASVARQRSAGQMLGLLAGLALALAAIGLYGLLAYLVVERTREIGIRLALGARPLDVLLQVLGGGLRLAAAGVVAGLVLAGALTRVLSGLLYTVSATDPATFALVVGVLIGAAACASYVPARRATRVDPIVALRCD